MWDDFCPIILSIGADANYWKKGTQSSSQQKICFTTNNGLLVLMSKKIFLKMGSYNAASLQITDLNAQQPKYGKFSLKKKRG